MRHAPRPLSYAERTALAADQPPDPLARRRVTALVAKTCGGSTPPPASVPVQKATPMPQPTFAQLVEQNVKLGMNPDQAWTLAGKQSPEAYQAYLRAARETKQAPVQKDVPVPPPPPEHWTVKELRTRVEVLNSSGPRCPIRRRGGKC